MTRAQALGKLFDIHPAWVPLDLQTARDGNWVSLKNAHGVSVVVIKGVGTDGDDPTISFQQASDVSGTGAKDLTVVSDVYEKEHVTTLPGTWSKVNQTAAASYAPGDPSAQSLEVWVFDIAADELDVDNGFDCIRVRCTDVGTNAQLGTAFYLFHGLRNQAKPENLPSPIAN